jgi:AAA family ATP:ADP antiporter
VSATESDKKGKTRFERFSSLFAAVRPGEGLTAALLAANIFTLLTAYYIIKPVREALILSGAGAEVKSYAGAAQALLFLLIVPLYSGYASRTNRIRLINGVTAFFITNLLVFFALGITGVDVGVAFFLWVGLFNLMLVAQLWAFANDIYTEQQGKRLFAIIGIGSALGAILGSRIAGLLFEPIGAFSMMLVAAGLLGVCMILTNWVHQREGVAGLRARAVQAPVGSSGGFKLILGSRYLLLIAMMVLLANLVNTTGEFILGKTVEGLAEQSSNPRGLYRRVLQWILLLGESCKRSTADVRRVTTPELCRGRIGIVRPASDRVGELFVIGVRPCIELHPRGQDRGEQRRLLYSEYGAARSLSQHKP